MKIALLCGGPSLERGISLNSARSALDHLSSDIVEVVPVYFDSHRRAFRVSPAQLYSNTPSDFDFKLEKTSSPLSTGALVRLLKSVDIVFPIMHGPFGEDGEIQSFLEKNDIPFVGSGSHACKQAFDKFVSNEFIRTRGFHVLPSVLLKIYHSDHRSIVEEFFKTHAVKRAIVKPATGGSSIGVFSVETPEEALEKVRFIFSKRMDTRLVIEPFAEGVEFTTIVLQNEFGLPVALPPTEIETDYSENQIFDFRRKYLPTHQVTWHCPPRFEEKVIEKIQAQAEQIFSLFGMSDFARFDGFVLPDGNIWFCDFNPVSGMEQNSFLFQQASRIGFTHASILRYILENACRRHHVVPTPRTNGGLISKDRKPVKVLFGGDTSERQVSLMSGTNVWLKLRKSKKYKPEPHLLDKQGNVWRLPYHLALNHTVEDIAYNCENYSKAKERLNSFEKRTRVRLGLEYDSTREEFFEPEKMSLVDFIKGSKFVFNALHGGLGEDGTMQSELTKNRVKFNGPDERVSKLCMDKWATLEFLRGRNIDGLVSVPGKVLKTEEIIRFKSKKFQILWKELVFSLGTKNFIVKPRSDGCSTGVARLCSYEDLEKYIGLLRLGAPIIPRNYIRNKNNIELPPQMPAELLLEKFVETDVLRVRRNELKHYEKTGWLEITVGVAVVGGKLKVFNPSITVAEAGILSVEEKFQGGTGVNITPPPVSLLKASLLKRVKDTVASVAEAIGILGYSRIDAFLNINNGNLIIIEVNTLPALTPSTVLYQQALAEKPPIFPTELLETLIENKGY
ncbi:MAG: hypothetical protein Q7S86_00665 [bacterium]|nr:hypothetical protein [bacterium]